MTAYLHVWLTVLFQSNQTCYQTGIVGMASDVAPQPPNISVNSPVPTQTHWGRPNRPISGGDVGAFQGMVFKETLSMVNDYFVCILWYVWGMCAPAI